jgi:hypothetical protein
MREKVFHIKIIHILQYCNKFEEGNVMEHLRPQNNYLVYIGRGNTANIIKRIIAFIHTL